MTDVNEQIPSNSFSFLHAFFSFLGVELCYFFFLFFSRLFFFFLLELRCFSSSLFGDGLFSFFSGGGCRICSSCFGPFFSWSWVVLLLFFFSFHTFFPFFFSFGVALFSSLFGVGLFSFFLLGGAEFVLLVFGLFSLFLIFWGPCFFSLSLLRSPEQAAPK